MTLGLLIFFLVFLNELIKWIGKSVLQEAAFSVHQRLFNKETWTKQRKMKKELLEDKATLLNTSAQDEFAKWARLRRKVDKGLVDLDKMNASIGMSRTKFGFQFSTSLWICTSGTQLAIGWWYRREAVFYLPPRWFGGLQWIFAFPFAPKGSVSCGAWQLICQRVIRLTATLVKDLILKQPVLAEPVEQSPPKSEKDGKKNS